ncbi:colicin E3/pyocin S6 family cytotoxin [Rhodococcus sp. NPDC003318]|uniref:colicin E3/pyocin S6 family cytotoxin n=1 Tax=Rhodococcus sp. NPDC003318 TaxID=3364503 RepID=UPI003696A0E6
MAADLQPLLEANPTTFNSSTGGGGGAHNYATPPKSLSGFPNARPAKRLGHRKRWQDDKGNTYEWDYQHGAVEKYDKNGRHQGEYDPETGAQTKPADPTRRPER